MEKRVPNSKLNRQNQAYRRTSTIDMYDSSARSLIIYTKCHAAHCSKTIKYVNS